MKEETIKSLFEKEGINVENIKSATNSFNSNVYIINDDSYVLKICNNESKMKVESTYMNYLKKYLTTADVISKGTEDDKNYIIMTFLKGENKFDEEADELNDKQLKNIGKLLGKLHNAPLIDEDNSSWINYLSNALEKTQEVLREVFGNENEIVYSYLRNYIDNKLDGKYKNSILHMDYRIGNLMFLKNNEVGLIDMESMKNGECVFDFVKTRRVLNDDKFNILLDGYKEERKTENNFEERLEFYTIFDSYTSLWWSAAHNRTDSDYYRMNYNIVRDFIDKNSENTK